MTVGIPVELKRGIIVRNENVADSSSLKIVTMANGTCKKYYICLNLWAMSESNLPINVEKIVKHWIQTSDEDFNTMLSLYTSKSYSWALFLGHISLEKLLKAIYVSKKKSHAPFTHNLFRLAELSEIELDDEYADWLDKITSFNINARYDDYKREFYTICTADFTKDWIEKIKTLRSWIKQML